MSDTTEAAKIPGNRMAITGSSEGSRPTASTYNGFAIPIASVEPVKVFWPKARSMPTTTRNATMTQRNGRHLGDGRCPSGNNRGVRKMTGRIPNNQPKLSSNPMIASHWPP